MFEKLECSWTFFFFFFINKSFFFTTLDPSPTNDAKNEAINFAIIFDLSALTSFGQWCADTLYDVRKRSRYQMREFFFRCPNSKSSAREKQQSFLNSLKWEIKLMEYF